MMVVACFVLMGDVGHVGESMTYSTHDGVEVDSLRGPANQTIGIGDRLHLNANDGEAVRHNIADTRSSKRANSAHYPADFLAKNMQSLAYLVVKIEALVLPSNGKTNFTFFGGPIRSVVSISPMVLLGLNEVDGPVGVELHDVCLESIMDTHRIHQGIEAKEILAFLLILLDSPNKGK
jgi:hypothetical protein